jgi:hypothetical protein
MHGLLDALHSKVTSSALFLLPGGLPRRFTAVIQAGGRPRSHSARSSASNFLGCPFLQDTEASLSQVGQRHQVKAILCNDSSDCGP